MGFPFRNYILFVIVLIHVYKSCILIQLWWNGKACAEKYEDINQARILMIFIIQD